MEEKDNFKAALEMLENSMLDEYPDMESLPKHEFSDRYLEQMKGIEGIAENRIIKVTRRKRFLKIASIVLCIFTSLAGVMVIYGTIKDWITVEIVYQEKNADLIYHIDESVPILNKIEDYYVPGWLPKGYEIVEDEKSTIRSRITYENSDLKMIWYGQTILKKNGQNLNNENIKFENVSLSNACGEAIYYLDSGIHYLLWTDGVYQYLLAGMPEKEILIQIAESIHSN